jgi:hypothetical protein
VIKVDTINIEVTKEELLVIIGALIKLQVATGVKDEQLLKLSSKLSTQAIDLLSTEDFNELLNIK